MQTLNFHNHLHEYRTRESSFCADIYRNQEHFMLFPQKSRVECTQNTEREDREETIAHYVAQKISRG